MNREENAALFRRFIDEVISGGNIAAVDEFMSPDFVEHELLPPGIPPGREGVKQFFSFLRSIFSDLHAEVEDVIAQDDKVVGRLTVSGTHTGQFLTLPPTGKQVRYEVIDIVRVADGRVVEHWGVADQLTMLQQLGVVPAPGS